MAESPRSRCSKTLAARCGKPATGPAASTTLDPPTWTLRPAKNLVRIYHRRPLRQPLTPRQWGPSTALTRTSAIVMVDLATARTAAAFSISLTTLLAPSLRRFKRSFRMSPFARTSVPYGAEREARRGCSTSRATASCTSGAVGRSPLGMNRADALNGGAARCTRTTDTWSAFATARPIRAEWQSPSGKRRRPSWDCRAKTERFRSVESGSELLSGSHYKGEPL